MSFGFEVSSADGPIQLDTTTWGWQFVTSFRLSEQNRHLRFGRGGGTDVLTGETTAGNMLFDGNSGRPYVPAGSELYAMNINDQYGGCDLIWNMFSYGVSGGFRRLTWGHINVRKPTEATGSYDPDKIYSTIVYVFAR